MAGNTERRLAKRLYERDGYQVIRSPSSGSVKRPQPDVLAAREPGNGEFPKRYAFEEKSCTSHSSPNRVYVTQREIIELAEFAAPFDAEPMVAARFSGDRTIYCVPPEALDESRDNGQGDDKTTYVLPYERAVEVCNSSPGAFAVEPLS